MRVTIGNILLGDHNEDLPIGGYSASVTTQTQQGRGTCTGLGRVRRRGSHIATFTIPTKLLFDTVSQAQKWIADTVKVGGYEGLLKMVYADGSETRFTWAVAKPNNLTHRGITVTASWSIEAGERLT